MGDTTIQWTHRTAPDGTPMRGASWNPTVGCDRESPGCDHCYAKTLHDRRHQAFLAGKRVAPQYAQPFEVVQLMPDRLDTPQRTRRPTTFFIDSVSDLFYGTDIDLVRAEKAGRPFTPVPFEFIDRVWAVMALCPQHTFIVLTKRADRMRAYLSAVPWPARERWRDAAVAMASKRGENVTATRERMDANMARLPLPNVWLVVSVENQAQADRRIPELLQTPAAVRGISAEPLLGSLNLSQFLSDKYISVGGRQWIGAGGIHWIIFGGESGTGARETDIDWIRSGVKQCRDAGVAPYVKQLGSNPVETVACPKRDPRVVSAIAIDGQPRAILRRDEHLFTVAGPKLRDKKGGDPAEWPEDLRVREVPTRARRGNWIGGAGVTREEIAAEMELWGDTPEAAFAALLADYRALHRTEVALAERIAREAHERQKEESTGDPYIRHVERVVASSPAMSVTKAIAWLHDVVEDNPHWSLARLEREGISPRVIMAVDLLTRWPTASAADVDGQQNYAAYIRRIRNSGDLFAVAVKIADLQDHLRPNCPERLRPRYEQALRDLGGQP
jgi:protein gp37